MRQKVHISQEEHLMMWMDILVMGVMEFEDGLISNWRDYFDMKAYETETARVLG